MQSNLNEADGVFRVRIWAPLGSLAMVAGVVAIAVYLSQPAPAQSAGVLGTVTLNVVPEFLPAVSESEARIEAELDKPTSVEFVETPLKDVVDFLKAKHQIEIVLDDKALDDAGVGPDTPVTRQLRSVSLRSALNLLLRPLELTFYIENDVLNVTTRDVAESQLVTRVYPVADLLLKQDYDGLVEAITTTIRPQTWDEVGGPATISEVPASSSLVISHTQPDHKEILTLLRALRAAKELAGPARQR